MWEADGSHPSPILTRKVTCRKDEQASAPSACQPGSQVMRTAFPGVTQRSRERAAGTPDFEARRRDRQERKRFERDRQEREVKIHKTKQKIQTKAQGLSSRELSMLLKTSHGHKPQLLTSAWGTEREQKLFKFQAQFRMGRVFHKAPRIYSLNAKFCLITSHRLSSRPLKNSRDRNE